MIKTRNVLMLAILSAGLLTAIAGTGVSMVTPVSAIDDDCEENGDDSCQEENQKVRQENNCKIVNKSENEDKSDNNTDTNTNTGDVTCWDFAQNPDDGSAITGELPPITTTTFDPFALIG